LPANAVAAACVYGVGYVSRVAAWFTLAMYAGCGVSPWPRVPGAAGRAAGFTIWALMPAMSVSWVLHFATWSRVPSTAALDRAVRSPLTVKASPPASWFGRVALMSPGKLARTSAAAM